MFGVRCCRKRLDLHNEVCTAKPVQLSVYGVVAFICSPIDVLAYLSLAVELSCLWSTLVTAGGCSQFVMWVFPWVLVSVELVNVGRTCVVGACSVAIVGSCRVSCCGSSTAVVVVGTPTPVVDDVVDVPRCRIPS